jgi:RNA polymerase sigma factor (TIGR02999 family)
MPKRLAPTRSYEVTDTPPATPSALDELFPRVYDELRQLAHRQLGRVGEAGTVNTTGLVHEAYLKLSRGQEPEWHDRSHFFALAARAMRFILVDRARERLAAKRDGGQPLTLDEARAGAVDAPEQLLAIHEAVERLEQVSPRLAEVVHLRFFAGFGHEEVAELMGVSVPTVKRDWARARTWLHRFMTEGSAGP